MLREASSYRLVGRRRRLARRYRLEDGRGHAVAEWSRRAFDRMHAQQFDVPVVLVDDPPRRWWWFEDRIYWEDDGLDPDDILALVRERERRRGRRLERAHAALAVEPDLLRTDGAGPRQPRTAIPRDVCQAVWIRDGGHCVACAATFELQFDHVIPLALGGANTVENLQILCGPCNREKGAAIA